MWSLGKKVMKSESEGESKVKQQRESDIKEGLDKTFPVKKTEKGWLDGRSYI